MDPVTYAWESQRLAGAAATPILILSLPKAERAYGVTLPPETVVDFGTLFDANVEFDAEVLFNGGGLALERAARLLRAGPVSESANPSQEGLFTTTGQASRPVLTCELDNTQGEFSRIVGEEFVINQPALLFLTFPGLAASDMLEKFSGRIARFTLEANRMTLEAEGP